MTLRSKLFLIIGGLMALLVAAETWLVRTLTRDLDREVGKVAFQVSESMISFLRPSIGFMGAGQAAGTQMLEGSSTGPTTFEVEAKLFSSNAFPADQLPTEVFSPRPLPIIKEGTSVLRVILQASPEPPHDIFMVDGDGVPREPHEDAGRVCGELRPKGTECLFSIEGSSPAEGRIRTVWSKTLQIGSLNLPAELQKNADGQTPGSVMMAIRLDLSDDAAATEISSLDAMDLEQAVDSMRTMIQEHGGQALSLPPITRFIPVPQQGTAATLEAFRTKLLLGSLGLFALGLCIAGYVAHRVSVPLRNLATAAQDVGSGALGTQIEASGDLEVASTIAAFNQMSTRLTELDAEARTLREREHLHEIGEMARGLAHSLRNPLNTLGLALDQVAAEETVQEERDRLHASARDQIARIDRSLRSFLALASGGGGTASLVNVADIARDVALEAAQSRRGAVRVEVQIPEPGVTLRAIEPELRAVLHTLVVNAVEASPENGHVRLSISVEQPDRLRILVEDEGPGLANSVAERLFTPHVTTKQQGAGMGLFLAQRILTTRYGGSLVFETREPVGTRVVLLLTHRTGGAIQGGASQGSTPADLQGGGARG